MVLYLMFTLLGGLILQVFIPGFPKETILLLAGSSFGIIGGSLINWFGMVIGAQVGYEVVQRSIRIGGRFAGILEDYENHRMIIYLKLRGNWGLFLLRLIPTAPNDVLSMLSGAVFLPRKGFVVVSVVTAIPYAVFFAYLGWVGSQFLGWRVMWMINLIVFAVTVILLLSYRISRQRSS